MRRNKYNARATMVHGIRFDSRREAEEYLRLSSMERQGEILGLTLKPRFEILPKFKDCMGNIERAVHYTPDFEYRKPDGTRVVVEVKGKASRDYPLRRKLFKRKYPGVEFVEVR